MLFILLLAVWLILNGRFTLEVVLLGVVFSASLTWFAHRQGLWPIRSDRALRTLLPRVLIYLLRLLWAIIVSSLQVMKLILSPRMEELQPRLVFFEVPLNMLSSQVALANSITLTPGTFTVGIYGTSTFCVHALTKACAKDVRHSEFIAPLQEMEQIESTLKGPKTKGDAT